MELLTISLTLVGLLIVFLGGGVWIGISLFLVGLGGFTFFLIFRQASLWPMWSGIIRAGQR